MKNINDFFQVRPKEHITCYKCGGINVTATQSGGYRTYKCSYCGNNWMVI